MIKCVSWNVQSIRNKCAEVMEHIIDHNAGAVFLTETWMEADKNDITAMVKSYGSIIGGVVERKKLVVVLG